MFPSAYKYVAANMGAYLSKPKTDIETEEGGNGSLSYCCASMQGWRLNQEDAHNAIPEFSEDCSLFAVYDGHGGPEVAQYASLHFPEFLKNLDGWSERDKDITKAFEEAFIGFDDKLRSPDVMKTLHEMANEGKRVDSGDNIDVDELDSEKPELIKEATLPLKAVLSNYGIQSKGLISYLMDQTKKRLLDHDDVDIEEEDDSDSERPTGARSLKRSIAPATNAKDVSDLNGSESKADDQESKETEESTTKEQEDEESNTNGTEKKEEDKENSVEAEEKADPKEDAEDVEVDVTLADGDKADGESDGSAPGPSRAISEIIKGADSDSDEDYDEDEEEEEDDSEEEEEDAVDYLSGGETPGDDSGATACVAAVFKDRIVVANAGDTRAVLCRNGEAFDLSYDHKPEDEIEKNRIYKAGGTISADGRVNGGLNLSRALGDHFYKKNSSLELKDQMISAMPDVKIEQLKPEDSFLVVACDGIWNSMSSQQVVDFVKERLDNGGELKYICEEICRHCLAPSTEGDGTGCDNITVIIVKLNCPYVAPATEEKKEEAEEQKVEDKPVEESAATDVTA
uniref:protein-serine/threonine phosphatase n=1 Tax=Steinernema glaseri TaxID=37863 RepID=A0A1I7Z135_9BILA